MTVSSRQMGSLSHVDCYIQILRLLVEGCDQERPDKQTNKQTYKQA